LRVESQNKTQSPLANRFPVVTNDLWSGLWFSMG
jgi:hypothetical protein